MPDLKFLKFSVPKDLKVLGSSWNLLSKPGFEIGNKTKNGFLYFYSQRSKKITRFWTFPNYFITVFQKESFYLFLRENIPASAVVFSSAFSKNFYKNLYGFAFSHSVTLHFVGVGYKIFFLKKRAKKKMKLFLWVGFCTWQIICLPSSLQMKKKKESFRLVSLKIFSHHPKYFRKLYMLIKNIRLSEPYKGKGIRFMDENILRKPGKTGRI